MTAMVHPTQEHSLETDARRAALRAELEQTRAAFHRILDATAGPAWGLKSPACDWTRGEVLVHLTWALEYLPAEVESARRGKGMFNLPKGVSDFLSYWYMRWLARSAGPDEIRRRYDHAMDAALALLDKTPGADWQLGANFYGEGFHSVADLFHAPAQHLADHTGE